MEIDCQSAKRPLGTALREAAECSLPMLKAFWLTVAKTEVLELKEQLAVCLAGVDV